MRFYDWSLPGFSAKIQNSKLEQFFILGSLNQLGSRANHVMFKKALSDEFETLLCLKICAKFEDGALRLVEHHSGLFTVAVCMMSNYSKSRVLSLHLLTRLCDMHGGHKQVSAFYLRELLILKLILVFYMSFLSFIGTLIHVKKCK